VAFEIKHFGRGKHNVAAIIVKLDEVAHPKLRIGHQSEGGHKVKKRAKSVS
jgi:hypothetical protein